MELRKVSIISFFLKSINNMLIFYQIYGKEYNIYKAFIKIVIAIVKWILFLEVQEDLTLFFEDFKFLYHLKSKIKNKTNVASFRKMDKSSKIFFA